MFEKYLNKNVVITTQVQGTALSQKYEGEITAIDENFVELDKNEDVSNLLFIILKLMNLVIRQKFSK